MVLGDFVLATDS